MKKSLNIIRFSPVYSTRGFSAKIIRDSEQTKQALQDAELLLSEPNLPVHVYLRIARLYTRNGKDPEPILKQGIERTVAPFPHELHFEMALLYMEKGERLKARDAILETARIVSKVYDLSVEDANIGYFFKGLEKAAKELEDPGSDLIALHTVLREEKSTDPFYDPYS